METLSLLGVALGLAYLAGINLYLTVFASGLAIHYHWIALPSAYQSLEVLGDPAVIIVAGILYFIEFFADKIPWIDSAWDAVHTVIRPIGGALLAVQALGHPSPAFTVIVALLGGGTSLVAHTAKATTRLTSNTSPEPFSNIGLSVAEDVAVIGGLALIHYNPLLAFFVFALSIVAFIYFAPKILRAFKAKAWLAWKKLNGPADSHSLAQLPVTLPPRLVSVFNNQNTLNERIVWTAPCLSGRGRRIPGNLFGALVVTFEEPRKLLFIARKTGRPFSQTIDLNGLIVGQEPKFLSENLVISPASGKGPRYLFIFPRPRVAMVERIVESLRERSRRQPEPEETVAAPAEVGS